MLNIMVVDDSSIIRKVFAKELRSMGYNVVGTAKDGKEAISMYDELNFRT